MSNESSSIQVVVRLRPMNEKEKRHSSLPVIKGSTSEKTVTVIKGQGSRQARSTFNFDNVFTAFSTQEEVFNATLQPMILDVMKGYESTIFAYGQTGTGKTHTMEGYLDTPELYGVIPRAAKAIFESINQPTYENASVKCSYLEIYNEELGDLLLDYEHHYGNSGSSVSTSSYNGSPRSSPVNTSIRGSSRSPNRPAKLEIMEGPNGPFCRGLTEKYVGSYQDVLSLMQKAQQSRKTGETKMNKHSSRSHCIFTIKVSATRTMRDGSSLEFSGKLHMVDLAGSECAKSAALDRNSSQHSDTAARERERMNINRSLLTLGRVIKLLKEQGSSSSKKSNNVRIPYRDSRLTRMLQESLGGRCKTLIVATLSPSATAIEESMSTLNYAQSASGIVNKPVSTSYMSVSAMSQGSSLEASLMGPNAVDTWHEMECRLEYMQAQVEEAQAALARKHLQQQEFIERAENAESLLIGMEKEVEEAKEEVTVMKTQVEYERKQREAITALQRETKIVLQKTTMILEATQKTETCLTEEAKAVLTTLEETVKDGDALYVKLLRAREYDIEKRQATKDFHKAMGNLLQALGTKLDGLKSSEEAHCQNIVQLAGDGTQREQETLNTTVKLIDEIKNDVQEMTHAMEALVEGEDGMKQILDNTTTRTAEKTQVTLDGIEEGEANLSQAFRDAKNRLEVYSDQIKSKNDGFLTLSEGIASLIEGRIMESKEKVSGLVGATSKALDDVKTASAKTRDHLDEVLKEIMQMSISSCNNMIKTSVERRKALDRSLEKFTGALARYGDIKKELDSQDDTITNDGGKHNSEIINLQKMLAAQKAAFQDAEKQQKKLQDQFIKNVFVGVKTLVDSEMRTLSEAKDEQFTSFELANEGMSTTNKSIRNSANDIFAKIKANTRTLRTHAQEAHQNDISMAHAAQQASSTFNELEGMTSSHQKSLNKYLDTGFGDIQKMVDQSNKLDAVNKGFQREGDATEQFIAGPVLDEAQSGIVKMSDATTNISEFTVNTMLPKIGEDIGQMEAPRKQWKAKMVSTLEDIKSAVEEEKTKLGANLEQQNITTSKLSDLIENKHDVFVNNKAKTIADNMMKHEKNIISQVERYSSKGSKIFSSCSSTLTTTNEGIDDFAVKKMECNKEPPKLDEKKEYVYSTNFASTPAADVILEGIDFTADAKFDNPFMEGLNEIIIPGNGNEGGLDSARSISEMIASSQTASVASDTASLADSSIATASTAQSSRISRSLATSLKRDSSTASMGTAQSSRSSRAPKAASTEKENLGNTTEKHQMTKHRSKSRAKKRASSKSRADPSRKRLPAMSTPVRTGNSTRMYDR